MHVADIVTTSLGEHLFVGGMLQLYELAHAVLPGVFVSIFTAKRGLRVELHKPKAIPVEPPAEGKEGHAPDAGGVQAMSSQVPGSS